MASDDLTKHIVAPGEGEQLRWGGPAAGGVTILVDPANTGQTDLCVLTQTLEPGAMVPEHHHDRAEQVLFILSGTGEISLGDHRIPAEPRATVHVPRGVAHGFTNTGTETLTVLEITSPSGFQDLFREMHRLAEPTLEDIVLIGSKHDIHMHADGDS